MIEKMLREGQEVNEVESESTVIIENNLRMSIYTIDERSYEESRFAASRCD